MHTSDTGTPDGDVQDFRVRLPRDLHERLRREAFEERTSINRLLIEGAELRLAQPRSRAAALPPGNA